MRDDLDDELPPCVGEKMRDIAQGFRQRPPYLSEQLPRRNNHRGPAKRCNREDAWAFYDWAKKQDKVPSPKQIAYYLGIKILSAYAWHKDFLNYYTPEKRKQK